MNIEQAQGSGSRDQETKRSYRNMVALFGKALQMDISKFNVPQAYEFQMIGGTWLVLGYFDALRFYELPIPEKSTWFRTMWEHNVRYSTILSGEFYYHPLHMTASIAGEEDRYRQFWEATDQPYIFLTMLQGNYRALPEENGCPFSGEERLIHHVKNVMGRGPNPDSFQDGEKGDGEGDVRYVCYKTLELSDLIILWRSNEPYKILSRLYKLYQDTAVGDLSTFPAIQYSFLERFKPDECASTDNRIFVSSQYVVKDSRKADNFFEEVLPKNRQQYFATGVEDIRIVDREMSAGELLTHLQDSLVSSERQTLFNEAFFGSATQIGIRRDGRARSTDRDKRLEKACGNLLEQFQKLHIELHNTEETDGNGISLRESSWVKAVSNLLNALTDMSRSWVMDGFCYLILDAARLFYTEIRKLYKAYLRGLSIDQLEGVQRFVRGWGTLMEQATKMDGRFLQMPGFSPALCEIPAKLLEFYLAFTRKCIKVMQNQGSGETCKGGGEPRIALMFVPKICRRVKVNSIFKEDESHNHLLYVDIPLDQMYSPMDILCCLSHEAAHFVGESWRNRARRRYELLLAISTEFATYLRLNSAHPTMEIYDMLEKNCASDEWGTAKQLIEEAHSCMMEIAANDLGKLFNLFMEDIKKENDKEVLYQLDSVQRECIYLGKQFLMQKSNMENIIENLKYLFQECYADLNMIIMLKLSKQEYVRMAEQELTNLASEESLHKNSQYYVIVERWYVLLGLDSIWTDRKRFSPDAEEEGSVLSTFCHDICRLLRESQDSFVNIKKKQNSEYRYYNAWGSIQYLKRYLEYCARTIRNDIDRNDGQEGVNEDVKLIQDAFRQISSPGDQDYDLERKLIDWTRQDLLQETSWL